MSLISSCRIAFFCHEEGDAIANSDGMALWFFPAITDFGRGDNHSTIDFGDASKPTSMGMVTLIWSS